MATKLYMKRLVEKSRILIIGLDPSVYSPRQRLVLLLSESDLLLRRPTPLTYANLRYLSSTYSTR